MTTTLIFAGLACVAFSFWESKKKVRFEEILHVADVEINGFDGDAIKEKSDSADIDSMRIEFKELGDEIKILRSYIKANDERISSMEHWSGRVDEIKEHEETSSDCGNQRFKNLDISIEDFDSKSLEELSGDTGLEKGELLLLKNILRKKASRPFS